jgi:putative serine protease PepD
MNEHENDVNQQPAGADIWRPPAETPATPPPAVADSQSSGAPASSAAPAEGAPGQPPAPASQPAQTSGAPASASGHPGYSAGWAPAGPGDQSQATQQMPYGPSAPSSGYATGAYPASGYPPTGYQPGYGQGAYGTPAVATAPPKKSNARKYVAAGLLALLLAGGGGAAGAAITHSMDSSNTVSNSSSPTVVSNAPIVDRSSLASIAAAVSPSVVSITTANAEGSGVVLSADGYILTNNHVAATAQNGQAQITFNSGKTVKATVVGTDPKTDLAVLKADGVSGLPVAKFGDSSALQVGDTVLAIGSPLGLDGSVTAGIVSALNRTINESPEQQPQNPFDQGQQDQSQSSSSGATIAGAIQTDAAINPGNSGGALVNTAGQVIGINTAIATSGSGGEGNIGVGFAIPANKAKQVVDDIIAGRPVSHPQLGVDVSTADSNGGALVRDVASGTAADKAGIKAGDVITAFDGKEVHTSDDLINDVQASEVNKQVTLTVVRNGQTVTINATLLESK